MAVDILDNVKIYLGGRDLSGDHNRIAVAYAADAKEVTSFGDTTRRFTGGLKTAGISGSGHWNDAANGLDATSFSFTGGNYEMTVAPLTGADGEVAYFMDTLRGRYQFGGAVGDVLPFSIEALSASQLVRGTILHTATRAATGTGTARQLTAASSTQKLYAVLHVLGAGGTTPTLDVVVRSAATSAMTGATNRITFTQATATGSEWAAPVSGAITDTWYDVSFTIGGTSPSFNFVVVVGIL